MSRDQCARAAVSQEGTGWGGSRVAGSGWRRRHCGAAATHSCRHLNCGPRAPRQISKADNKQQTPNACLSDAHFLELGEQYSSRVLHCSRRRQRTGHCDKARVRHGMSMNLEYNNLAFAENIFEFCILFIYCINLIIFRSTYYFYVLL